MGRVNMDDVGFKKMIKKENVLTIFWYTLLVLTTLVSTLPLVGLEKSIPVGISGFLMVATLVRGVTMTRRESKKNDKIFFTMFICMMLLLLIFVRNAMVFSLINGIFIYALAVFLLGLSLWQLLGGENGQGKDNEYVRV